MYNRESQKYCKQTVVDISSGHSEDQTTNQNADSKFYSQ